MNLITWMTWQLLSYNPVNWLLFIGIALLCSRLAGVVGVFIGHILVAVTVLVLDIGYAATHAYMDMDIVFTIGVFVRVVLINTVLLPVSFAGLWLRGKRKQRQVREPDAQHKA